MNALKLKNRSRVRRGFTLIELLLVMVIIAILATILVPRVVNRVGQAKNTKAQADLSTLKQALTAFDIDNGRFPTTSEGLQALITKPADLPNWQKTLDKNTLPMDPWGRPYIYRSPGNNGTDFDLLTGGPDGQEGSAGAIAAD
ncbi:MAG: type II secretion system major pseudopilin GspG [Tepidisphaeraceae bacterium]|jgi:general secretion pathway protein G